MKEEMKQHINAVHAWLDKHVKVFSQPKVVTLSDFNVNWDEFSGNFRVMLDAVELPVKLKFGLESSGETKFHLPMFHSPLGAPSSYAAIQLTPKTLAAISQGLHQAIPKVMAVGSNKVTGQNVPVNTPLKLRLSADALEEAMSKLAKGYSVRVPLKKVK